MQGIAGLPFRTELVGPWEFAGPARAARASRELNAVLPLKRFAPLGDFLESIPATCPHDLFRRGDDPNARASQASPAFADVSRIIVNRKENAATATAALIIPAVGNNKLRHETLQRLMLAKDSVTSPKAGEPLGRRA